MWPSKGFTATAIRSPFTTSEGKMEALRLDRSNLPFSPLECGSP